MSKAKTSSKTIAALSLSIAMALLGVVYLVDMKKNTADLKPKVVPSLPGPNGKLSARSFANIETLLGKQDHVLGVWVAKLKYDKYEFPIIWYSTKTPEVEEVVKNFAAEQLSGRGNSSAENDASKAQKRTLRNSTESKMGQIVCGALDETSLPTYSDNIQNVAKSVCRATIPPFSQDVNMAIIATIDIPMTNSSPESLEIRRALLQLQLDIYNRDYLNREVPILVSPDPDQPEKYEILESKEQLVK